MKTRCVGWAVLVLVAGVPASVVAQEGETAPAEERILPRPLAPPAAFEAALGAGTRSPDGRPGPTYWQQRADYRIEAALDPGSGRLEGRETITYPNRSPHALGEILLHLDQNVHAPGARRNRRAPVTGGMTLHAVRVDGTAVEGSHAGRGYYEALTLFTVPLPDSLAPGEVVEIEVEWEHVVPPAPTFRAGNLAGEILAVAQWYPRVAVYDDVYGWDATPYLGDGEFYLEYGDFDVSLALPAGWLVGATGTLANPGEVLAGPVRERLALAATVDTTVRVVTPEMRSGGEVTRGGPGETLVWHFRASDVRDFAFATSDAYLWDALRVWPEDEAPEGTPAADGPVLAHALYRPRVAEAWREGARYTAHTLRTLSEWLGPYLYPQLTITEGPVGGMEYPMLVFNPSTTNPTGLASVTIHEGAHQWFPMMVGSMEAKHAWMDEGLVSYWDELSLAVLQDGEVRPWGLRGGYLSVAGTEAEVPIMRHTDLVSPYGARGLAAYSKPAIVLGALRAVVGDAVFQAAFEDYVRSWTFRHPQPWDFFNTVERHAGRDLDWFWRPFLFETDVLDHAVDEVTTEGGRSTVVLRDLGHVVLPTPVRLTWADGTVRMEWVSAEAWLEVARVWSLTVPGEVVEVLLDPDGLFPDVDRQNSWWARPDR